jgi:hypothetical protein
VAGQAGRSGGLFAPHPQSQGKPPFGANGVSCRSPVAAAPQVYGSTRVPDDIAAEEIGMLTQLRGLKDLELNQCAPPPSVWPPTRSLPCMSPLSCPSLLPCTSVLSCF